MKADVISANDILLRGVSFDGFSRRLHATENMCCSEMSALRESLSAQQDQLAAQIKQLEHQQILLTKRLSQFELGGKVQEPDAN